MQRDEMFYRSLSKFELVAMLKERGEAKYAHSRTKPEIVRLLLEMDQIKKEVVCMCQKQCVS
jgi:hypothetical protein